MSIPALYKQYKNRSVYLSQRDVPLIVLALETGIVARNYCVFSRNALHVLHIALGLAYRRVGRVAAAVAIISITVTPAVSAPLSVSAILGQGNISLIGKVLVVDVKARVIDASKRAFDFTLYVLHIALDLAYRRVGRVAIF